MLSFKKFFAILVICAVMIPMVASATVTRMVGLGGGDVTYITKDQSNSNVWPQLVKKYGNRAGAEFAGNSVTWDANAVWATYDFGDEKSVLYFGLNKYQVTKYTEMPDAVNDGPGINNALSIKYGRPLGENMLIGAGLSYASEGFTQKATAGETNTNASDFGLDLGVSCIKNNWDLVVGFDMASFTDEAGGTKLSEPNGMMGIHLDGRWWYNYSDNASLIPNLRFSTLSDGMKASGGFERTHKTTAFSFGAGHNWWPADNALVIFDFGFAMRSTAHEFKPATTPSSDSTDSWSAMPYWRVGAETKVFGWLDGRIGAERFWASHTPNGDRDDEMTHSYMQTNTYVGATAHWNRLSLDLLVHPDFLMKGPYFVSGDATTEMFSQVSLVYDFKQ
ncbi:hypothetical protein HZB60_00190 [candidate division KSB1 bacterium]|nr:hypothetical protein [candidate division KSB1 bacterium]